ncbi:hypothetical protein TREPR_2944 [Treponema primitia ZAS-2]|uniref:Helicase XPB/Ssl2 N-terminal domain-containing protein n=1 Tax=Treponema primitia (strain ATCC BAA-887 / DSM 12427 / ZAS-2) TaxID=545694 RepID=F5YP58_TREPZ|nr:hypothetical protein [Treponema primitia]AEF85857.1 hypothetical protein TREPR_2944 [Treponema primitia ZAS-2]
MKDFQFRSPDTWKSALLTLPDSAYFELMRSVFGNIKTPFNKQRLVEDLEGFFSRKEIQEIIAAYLDETDARIITAVAALDEPAPGELETFFAGELSFAELHSILLNLEERLILYRFQDRGVSRLALNPLLEPVLGPLIADKGSLFPSETRVQEGGGALLDDRVLAALFAFIPEEPDFFKAEGGVRKKVLDDGKLLFPALDLETLIGGLQNLGLLSQKGEGLAIDELRLRHFGSLSSRERREYLAAGLCFDKNPPKPFPGMFNRSRIQALTRFIHTYLDILKPDRQYPKTTLKRIADILERSGIEQVAWDAEISSLKRPGPELPGSTLQEKPGVVSALFDSILSALKSSGLLGMAGEWYFLYPLETQDAGSKPVIAMDTAFSCILYPEIGFTDALALASFCVVRETGTAVRFELTRESVVRGFDRNLDSQTMLSLLDRLSGNQVEQNLRWTVKDWESRYSGVSLFQGLVLSLSEDRRYLAEAEPVASLIFRTLNPGVYLLSVSDKADAVQALHKAGIDIIAQPPQITESFPGERHSPYPSLEAGPRFRGNGFYDNSPELLFPKSGGNSFPFTNEKSESYKGRFRSALESISLSKPERDELTARIERRLILNESQLVGVSVRYEKLEARGLDYVGKTSIAKQAIASKLLIEIMWSDQNGELNRVIGIPEALEKSGGDTILVLKPVSPGETIRLPLGKISLLRRIKQSIFGE